MDISHLNGKQTELDDKVKQLAQRATALFRQSSAVNKQSGALSEESSHLNTEAIRLYGAAKRAGFFDSARLRAQADSFHKEGNRLSEEGEKLLEEGRRLGAEGSKLLDEAKRLKSEASFSEPSVNFVTCRCQHCDTGIEFDPNQLNEENNVIPCPHCGLETKLFVPPSR